MDLKDLGYNQQFEKFRIDNHLDGFDVGRIIAAHKERYIVKTACGEFESEITGNLRFTAKCNEDFPTVGDWVALSIFDADFAIIQRVLPRFSVLSRQAVGQYGEVQIIAANIDYAFLILAVDRDFSINRLERYLTLCNTSGVNSIIVLSKTDLINPDQVSALLIAISNRIKNIPVIAISNETRQGYESLKAMIEKGKTYCMLGSSGVGKSSLLNNLSGKSTMRTDTISHTTNRGRHITSHRELLILESGGMLIDNPGMREVGIADRTNGLEITFDSIVKLSHDCKFKDCTHTNETGCRVIEAIEKGEIDKSSFENFMKMEKEKAHFEATVEEKRKKDKTFGKMIKNYKKDLKKNKY